MNLRIIMCFILFLRGISFAGSEDKFSMIAWENAKAVYHAIRVHPFNKELLNGSLPKKLFTNYSDQDSLFLVEFEKALTILASKLKNPYDVASLKKIINQITPLEKEAHEKLIGSTEISPATALYINYLLATAAFKTKEELAAALLPCFWIYLRLADEFTNEVSVSNPYLVWIRTYSSPRYRQSVDFMISLTDKLAKETTNETRLKMFEAFMLAFRMEWYFWDGAYKIETWKP